MGAFKRCDYCARTVNWNDLQERRTWLELHWDILDEGHPEQVWDFCCWDCVLNFGLGRRRGTAVELVRELGDRLLASGTAEEDYVTALEQEKKRRETHRDDAQSQVRSLLDELERGVPKREQATGPGE